MEAMLAIARGVIKAPLISDNLPPKNGYSLKTRDWLRPRRARSESPADVYLGRGASILERRDAINRKSIEQLRFLHQYANA
jgi:hypothetical protein